MATAGRPSDMSTAEADRRARRRIEDENVEWLRQEAAAADTARGIAWAGGGVVAAAAVFMALAPAGWELWAALAVAGAAGGAVGAGAVRGRMARLMRRRREWRRRGGDEVPPP